MTRARTHWRELVKPVVGLTLSGLLLFGVVRCASDHRVVDCNQLTRRNWAYYCTSEVP